jgi:pimeloyl-ACP methyl ester carboxylesterase
MQRFDYADTDRGQVHFRECGRGDPFVLLHWAPGSSRQYAAVMDAIAEAGFRGIAPDLPGFGASFRRNGHWSIAEFAGSVLEFLDALDLPRCVLIGGHLSSEIALEAALRAPDRFTYVGLDGTPTWDEPLRRSILAKAMPHATPPAEDGSHVLATWQHTWWEVRMWRPNAPFDESLANFAWQLLGDRIQAGFDMRPARALLEYDAVSALQRVQVPVLALCADDDPLRSCHETVIATARRVAAHLFPGDHPLHDEQRAAEYVAPLVAHLRAVTSGRHA